MDTDVLNHGFMERSTLSITPHAGAERSAGIGASEASGKPEAQRRPGLSVREFEWQRSESPGRRSIAEYRDFALPRRGVRWTKNERQLIRCFSLNLE